MSARTGWARAAERGSMLGLRVTVACYRLFGRSLSQVLVHAVVAYFFVTGRSQRRASRAYLRRVASAPGGRAALGREPGTWASFLQFRAFALSIFDRLVLWLGREGELSFEVDGLEHYDRLLTPTRGAIVVGAHLGSFDALRALARRDGRAVSVLMYTRHAPRINAMFRELSPEAQMRVIQVERDSMTSVLHIRACIDRGELVAMLGDRVEPADRGRTCAVVTGMAGPVRGRILPTTSACTSGSQGIGYAYETIRFGRQEVMIAGGTEELDGIDAAIFDILLAASTRNDEPERTPRPYDTERDGLVVAEGAATLVLEELEFARARGAPIVAEILGYGTNCDGAHMTTPDTEGMEQVMRLALDDAGLAAEDIDYVNTHGTGTELGDIAESQATWRVFGDRVPASTLKGHTGHTLGACGALEAWIALEMAREGWVAPTLNLENVDPRCGALDYVMGGPRELRAEIVISNNFAFGGVNTSLVFRLETA